MTVLEWRACNDLDNETYLKFVNSLPYKVYKHYAGVDQMQNGDFVFTFYLRSDIGPGYAGVERRLRIPAGWDLLSEETAALVNLEVASW